MAAVSLNPKSKVALLEQSKKIRLNHVFSTCFPKVLFVNRGFVYLARENSIYRLSMHPGRLTATFQFQNNKGGYATNWFKLTPDQACMWVKFLDPPFFAVHAPTEKHSARPLLQMIHEVTGKIGFSAFSTGIKFIDLIQYLWNRISELKCDADLLPKIAGFPPKKFDLLDVWDVRSMNSLDLALKQKTSCLILVINFYGRFVGRRILTGEALVNDTVEQCTIRWSQKDSPILNIIYMVGKTCSNLKRLNVSCFFYGHDLPPTIRSSIAYMTSTNILIEQVVKELKKVPAECTITAYLDLRSSRGNKYPRDCVEMFRRYIHFEPVQQKIQYLSRGRVSASFVTKREDQNVSMDYMIWSKYRHLEDRDIEMLDEDDVDVDIEMTDEDDVDLDIEMMDDDDM